MSEETSLDGAIAIVGMAGRFPKSPDVDSFWHNVRNGVECLTRLSPEQLEEAGGGPAQDWRPN